MTYVAPSVPTLADELEGIMFDAMAGVQPGWVYNRADPLSQMLSAVALVTAEAMVRMMLTAEQLTESTGILHGIVRRDAVPAIAYATVTFNDGDPHTIEAGDTFAVTAADGSESLWAAVTAVTATTTTTTGQVQLICQNPVGADGNDITGTAIAVQPSYSWINTVTLLGLSSGGVDQEPYPDYYDRVARELTARSGLIIKADQLAARSLGVPTVARALALRTYNPTGPDPAAPGHMTVALADADGADVDAGTKADVEALPTADGVTLHAVNFNDHTVVVEASVVAHDDWDTATVEEACETALAAFLSPLSWGARPEGDIQTMTAEDTVYLDQVAGILWAVPGVRSVDFATIKIGVDAGLTAHADATLSGDFPLAKSGTHVVTVS